MNTYNSLDISFDKGDGAYLWAADKRYLDLISGIAVCGLGHANTEIADAIYLQAQTLIHTTNYYKINNQNLLADKLCNITNMHAVFFGNSGAEANEAAIKIARKFGHNKNINNPTIIVMDNSFHGRTMATLSATGNRKVQSGFEPLVEGFVRVPFNDITAIKEVAKNNPNIVAILVEPIQGEGGVNVPDVDYLQQLQVICKKQQWLLMLDEIQTGMARTGSMFHFQQHGIQPDVLTLAKGLANGVPIGACLVNNTANVLTVGNHGSTFGGNPLATKVALTTINIIERDNLAQRALILGELICNTLSDELTKFTDKFIIKNKGLMIGIDLQTPCNVLVQQALAQNLLINVTADTVVRLLPPLILTDKEAVSSAKTLAILIKNFLK